MRKRTPGPWQTKTMNDGSRNVIADNEFICEFSHEKGSEREKQEANGRLIAAAPDLLEAIEGLLNALPSATTHPAIRAARAAIAKATGET